MNAEGLLQQDFGLIADLVRAHAQEQPDHRALVKDEDVLTYGQLDALMDRIAASLQRDGLQCGDVIAICALSSVEYAAVFLGALRAGVVVAPLAPSATPESLIGMLVDCGAKKFFMDDSVAKALASAPLPKGVEVIGLDGGDFALPLQQWLAPNGVQPKPVAIGPNAPFNIIYSSGTTGTPKGIVQPHKMRWAHVKRAAGAGYNRQAVTICSTPLYSNTTLVSFFPAIAGGGTVVLMAKFDAVKFLELAQKHRATHAMLVPVQYQRIMDVPDFDKYDLSSFVMKFCTSAPFSAALKADILKRWPGGLTEFY
ncbi:MAG TPA: class I adenylate-forming enzyme family protein, partial [Steroidobacteraceae bacterium]